MRECWSWLNSKDPGARLRSVPRLQIGKTCPCSPYKKLLYYAPRPRSNYSGFGALGLAPYSSIVPTQSLWAVGGYRVEVSFLDVVHFLETHHHIWLRASIVPEARNKASIRARFRVWGRSRVPSEQSSTVNTSRRPPRPGRVKSSLHISAQSAKCIRRLMRGAGGGIIFGI